MKKKNLFTMVLTVVMTLAMAMTAFAASWQKNDTGWWWDNGNGTWPANTWQWIDGNNDGVSECYYFDANGYMLAGTTTPDGYTVNADGAWTIDGFTQTQKAAANTGNTATNVSTTDIPTGYNADGVSNVVLDMLDNTRAGNAAKYGETEVLEMGGGSEAFVYYNNGFRAYYNGTGSDEKTYYVTQGLGADATTVFKYATGASSADDAEVMLEKKGFDVVSNGTVATVYLDKYLIYYDGFSGTERVMVLKKDKYR